MREKHLTLGPLTVEEYLAFEDTSDRRHEFVGGRVYAVTGSTARHNRIVSNINGVLRTAARGGPCSAYVIDLKVRASRDRIYYPDGVVVCKPHDGDTLIFDEPCLILEVTSRSTRRIDRGEKLDAYLAMPSLRAYMIAEHDRRHVSLYTRQLSGAWEREEIVTSGSITLPCPTMTLSLDDIYESVELPPLRIREGVIDDDFGEEEDDDEWAELLDLSGERG